MQDAQGGGIAYLPADATAGETPQRSVPGREEAHALHVRTPCATDHALPVLTSMQTPCIARLGLDIPVPSTLVIPALRPLRSARSADVVYLLLLLRARLPTAGRRLPRSARE